MARFLLPKNPWMYDYGSDALDGDVDKVAFEEPVPHALQFHPPWVGFGGGARVSSRNMPTKLRLKGRKRKLLDFDNQYHMLLVNRRFIDLIGSFQKEVQYFPIECVWSDGSAAGQRFFFFTTVDPRKDHGEVGSDLSWWIEIAWATRICGSIRTCRHMAR